LSRNQNYFPFILVNKTSLNKEFSLIKVNFVNGTEETILKRQNENFSCISYVEKYNSIARHCYAFSDGIKLI